MRTVTGNNAFWVKGNKIIDLYGDKHIDYIIHNLNQFKLNQEEVKEIYKKYNEPYGFEGKAREELIKLVAKDGWVRIRYYLKRGNDYWSIQCDNYKRREKSVFNFIDFAIDNKYMGYHDPVSIISYDVGGISLSYSFSEGGISKLYESKNMKLIKFCDQKIMVEISLARAYQHAQKGFFLISAFYHTNSEKENLMFTDKLKIDLRNYGLGFEEVYGKWIEDKGTLDEISVIEISLFVPYRETITSDQFYSIAVDLMQEYKQEAIFYKEPGDKIIYLLSQYENKITSFNRFVPNKMADAYTKMKDNANKIFVFEGIRR